MPYYRNEVTDAATDNIIPRFVTTYSSSYRPLQSDLRRLRLGSRDVPLGRGSFSPLTEQLSNGGVKYRPRSQTPSSILTAGSGSKPVTSVVVTRGGRMSTSDDSPDMATTDQQQHVISRGGPRPSPQRPTSLVMPDSSSNLSKTTTVVVPKGGGQSRDTSDVLLANHHPDRASHRRLVQPTSGSQQQDVWHHRPVRLDSTSTNPAKQRSTLVQSTSNNIPTASSHASNHPEPDTHVSQTGDKAIKSTKPSSSHNKSSSPSRTKTRIVPYSNLAHNFDLAAMFSQIARITDHLYLSSLSALTPDRLHQHGITLLITAMIDPAPNQLRAAVANTLHVSVEDTELASIWPHFDRVADRIAAERRRGGKSLVHCAAGVSRSSSLVLAYLIRFTDLSLAEAYQLVKSIRPCIQPNSGFWRQLVDYEGRVRGRKSVKLVSPSSQHHFNSSSSILANRRQLSPASSAFNRSVYNRATTTAPSSTLDSFVRSSTSKPSHQHRIGRDSSYSRSLPVYSSQPSSTNSTLYSTTKQTNYHPVVDFAKASFSNGDGAFDRRPQASLFSIRQPLG